MYHLKSKSGGPSSMNGLAFTRYDYALLLLGSGCCEPTINSQLLLLRSLRNLRLIPGLVRNPDVELHTSSSGSQ
jgi:hypothetical protein